MKIFANLIGLLSFILLIFGSIVSFSKSEWGAAEYLLLSILGILLSGILKPSK